MEPFCSDEPAPFDLLLTQHFYLYIYRAGFVSPGLDSALFFFGQVRSLGRTHKGKKNLRIAVMAHLKFRIET